jgi:D-2-hydroxyacid dehydrogenase (NADP+)
VWDTYFPSGLDILSMRHPIVVDPDLGTVTESDIVESRPAIPVMQPDDVTAALCETTGPKVLLLSNRTWKDSYLDGLSAGDWVTTSGVGYEDIPLGLLEEANVTFTNSPGISAEQIAEHVFAGIFSFTRQLHTYRKQQRAHDWSPQRSLMTDLSGDTCCVIGLGGIGENVAERAKAFGMTVRGIKRTVEGYEGAADEVYQPEELLTALDGARLLVIAVPLNPETRGMIDIDELSTLTDDAIVVNVARGPILGTDALLAALREDSLSWAFLDVTDPEPLPRGHPLWDRDDVLITPHCAAGSDKYTDRYLEFFFAQFDRWRTGGDLRNQVTGTDQ